MENIKPVSVSDATKYIKSLLENDLSLNRIYITGEISNLKQYKMGGQIYLTLKDKNSQMSCVIFNNIASKLPYKLSDGQMVNIVGRVSVFEKRGSYNLQVYAIEPVGVGPLALAFEQIKKKLSAEGLFDASRKKEIPRYPESVAVISSPSGAALWDIVSVARRRAPYLTINLYPSVVQGESAPKSLIKSIKLANKNNKDDLIILARGGGSLEDLFCFNDEKLAYTIAESKIPVVSAVGHEVDFSISDFVADMRAPTPTGASEMLFLDVFTLSERIESYKYSLLAGLKESLVDSKMFLDSIFSDMNHIMKDKLKEASHKLSGLIGKLETLNPLSVMERGFSITKSEDKVIVSTKDCYMGQKITTRLSDGEIKAQVYQVISSDAEDE